jgi:hypothetical protein
MRNDKKMKKLNIIKWLGVFLVLHILATGCATSGVRDPFAKEWVSKAEYQERLETKYRPWYQSLSEAEKTRFHQTLDKQIDVGMAQMKLGAQMMQGGPIY